VRPKPFRTAVEAAATIPSAFRDRVGLWLVLGSIAALVLIRFFTEVVHVAPRALNFLDVPLFGLLLVAAALTPFERAALKRPLSFAPPAFLFLAVCIVSVMLNLSRVAPGPVFVFLYGFLAPLGVYTAVYKLWPKGNALAVSRLIVALGLVQFAVVYLIDLPRFLSSDNPDQITGTFGTNAYQLVFFLLVFTGLLAGIFTLEKERIAARVAPLLFVLALGTVFLAQYRTLLVTSAIALIVVATLLGSKGRGLVAGLLVVAAFVGTLSYVAHAVPQLKFATTIGTLERNPAFYASERLRALRNVLQVYEEDSRFILTGTGPGTFSSRAWQTFSRADSTSASNVQGRYVLALTNGAVYHTDVSDKYVLPESRTGQTVEGSRQVTSPFASYISLLAEVGLPGFALIVGMYLLATAWAIRMAVVSTRTGHVGDPLPGVLIACVAAFVVLLQMGVLSGNWFEVTRVTFLTWTLLAIGTKEFHARREVSA
jgi:hypothetical protein